MTAAKKINKEPCRLKEKQGIEAWCMRGECIFWRLIETQDTEVSNKMGCGLQHFGIVESVDPDVAKWLLQIKQHLENTNPDDEKARITFKHREQYE